MSRLRYVLLAALAAGFVAVAVVVAVVGRGGSAPPARSLGHGQLVSATATLSPQSLLFGQPIHVRVEAVVDRRQLDPRRVRLDAHWTPFQSVAPPVRTKKDVGPFTRLVWTVDLHCVTTACVPKPGLFVRETMPVGTITYDGRTAKGGSVTPLRLTWPEVTTVSRLDPSDLQPAVIIRRSGARQPQPLLPWRLSSEPLGTATYRLVPTTVLWGTAVAALLLVLAAAVILAPYLPALDGLGRRPPARSPLERALETVESAREGEPADTRKALALLAAELGRSGSGTLAWTASELAWSRSEPPSERTAELARQVRSELAGRVNGHHA